VKLIAADAEPDAAGGAQRLGLRHLFESEQAAIELAGLVFAARRSSKLDVIELHAPRA
jgi:hypothetical protein